MSKEERILEALELFAKALDNATAVLRQELARVQSSSAGVSEESFNILKWEASKGEKLGEFEVAYQNSNIPDKWNHAFNTLKANNATINAHYASEGYVYNYWLYLEKYQDRIFRKRRQEQKGPGK